jgi:predicted GNAT family acetyltransferase
VSDIEVQDVPDGHRFDLLVDGVVSGKADYRVRDGVVAITHSEVDPSLRGRGLGDELARRTLDLLREQGATVLPLCPFFAHYVKKHPDYDDMIAS